MRFLGIVAACAVLAGCAASKQEVVTRLGDQYIGQNIDRLVVQFGPPTSTFKMNSGQSSYVWQLSSVTDIETDRGWGTASTRYSLHATGHKLGDLTKLVRCVEDALTGIVWLDDSQVIEQSNAKYYGLQAGVMVRVFEVG